LNCPYVISFNPRLDYLSVLQHFFTPQEDFPGIHPSTVVEKGAQIAKTACIGAHCFIGPEVSIGENTIIKPNTTIYGKVTIGNNCYIKAGVSIGGEGFGFERNENGIPIHFPHCGKVLIGNNVYLGANVTVARATIDATIIEDNVKIDDLTLISHNCHIHKNTIIIGGLGFGGGTEIGENCWIAGSTIQKVKIGDNCKVCAGSLVMRNVKSGETVFGIPAKSFKV
jgi:UDP-3-O-[3-hydroxymyristoyl] glucosamine N-acyltransferase